jgi:hypothetical protein
MQILDGAASAATSETAFVANLDSPLCGRDNAHTCPGFYGALVLFFAGVAALSDK